MISEWSIVSYPNYHVSVPITQPPTTTDVAGLASSLRVNVFRLSRRLRREADSGLSYTLLSALATVDRHGPITAGALAQHEQVRKPTITRTVGALVELGLIERRPDPLDGRVAWLTVGPAGRRVLQRVRRRSDEYLARRIEELEPSERETLARAADLLERIQTEDER